MWTIPYEAQGRAVALGTRAFRCAFPARPCPALSLRVPFRWGSAPDPSRVRGPACAHTAKLAALWTVQELRSSEGRASALRARSVTPRVLHYLPSLQPHASSL